jgi:hypothetical protein
MANKSTKSMIQTKIIEPFKKIEAQIKVMGLPYFQQLVKASILRVVYFLPHM